MSEREPLPGGVGGGRGEHAGAWDSRTVKGVVVSFCGSLYLGGEKIESSVSEDRARERALFEADLDPLNHPPAHIHPNTHRLSLSLSLSR